MMDDGEASISHVLMVCAFATFLQEEFCVDLRNVTSSFLERSVLLWIPHAAHC